MTTYTATSNKFGGHITLTFDDEGNLRCIGITQAELSTEWREWLFRNLPLHVSKLPRYTEVTNFIITEHLQEVRLNSFTTPMV